MEERKTKQHDQMESLVRHFYEIPGKVVMLHDGEYLFHEGDMARYFYIVRSGQIFITKYAMSGRVLSLRLASRGSIIGELPLYEKEPVYIFNAVAQSAAEVYAIEFPVLQSYLEKKPGPPALRQEGRALLDAHPPGQQLRQGDGRRHPHIGAADEPRAGQLLGDGAREPQPHAQRASQERHHRVPRPPDLHQGHRLPQRSHLV